MQASRLRGLSVREIADKELVDREVRAVMGAGAIV